MRRLKLPVAEVHTSAFHRAVETGQLLGFGDVKPSLDFTEGGLVVTPIENSRRAQALRKFAGTMPPAGFNVILVTHKPNILDAFGKDWFDVREGEASIFSPDGNGGFKLVTRLQADEWSKLAQAEVTQPPFASRLRPLTARRHGAPGFRWQASSLAGGQRPSLPIVSPPEFWFTKVAGREVG